MRLDQRNLQPDLHLALMMLVMRPGQHLAPHLYLDLEQGKSKLGREQQKHLLAETLQLLVQPDQMQLLKLLAIA